MRRFIFLSLVGGLGLLALLSLGIWQMQRLAWKEDILATIEARIADAPGPLPEVLEPERDKYLPVRLEGEILPGELHVLTSIQGTGAGYRVIAPFVTDGGRRLLLDRGFIIASRKDETRTTGLATVIGNLHWPVEVDGFTPEPDTEKNIWYARDVAPMAAELGTEPAMVILRELRSDVVDPSATLPQPVTISGIANDHLQYALTWFSLAFIWAAMTAYFLWRNRAKSEG